MVIFDLINFQQNIKAKISMQVNTLCHRLLTGTIHLKRLNSLVDVVAASLTYKTLSVTQMARKLKGTAKTKSCRFSLGLVI